MRIVSGKFKGRRFSPPTHITARPTTDFAKESLFNVLNKYIDFEACVALDLFSGTGSISYEFASRGAMRIVSVEMSDKHLAFIHKIRQDLGLLKVIFPIKMDVFRYIQQGKEKFDIIFADPPYEMKELPSLPGLVLNSSLLNETGIFVLEHSAKQNFSADPNFLEHRQYGNVNFSLFTNKSVEA
ncbi:MAG: putative methyltransferase, RsmD family [Bacteroidetes bacterium]|nr:putative methyltransferase, RsmD family [Bacteroidota bacterium]